MPENENIARPGEIKIQTYLDPECTKPYRVCFVSSIGELNEAVDMIETQDFGRYKYFDSEDKEVSGEDVLQKF